MVYNEITFHSDASTLEYRDLAIWTFTVYILGKTVKTFKISCVRCRHCLSYRKIRTIGLESVEGILVFRNVSFSGIQTIRLFLNGGIPI